MRFSILLAAMAGALVVAPFVNRALAGGVPERPYTTSEEREPCDAYEPQRRPLFGDTHVHTSFSFDANVQDTRNAPRDAYRFARGEPMGIQPYDDEGRALRTIRLSRPLDFVAVTDHSELLGEVHLCTTPGSAAYASWICTIHRNAPRFAVWALQDPGSSDAPGTPLQRIQIVKGWVEGGELRERVFDVAGGDHAASVDIRSCEPRGAGARSLCAVWKDPVFDAGAGAFYYARILENPTCRWSQYVCNAAAVDCDEPSSVPDGLEGCCADTHQPVIQERAWTSPIWYTPWSDTGAGAASRARARLRAGRPPVAGGDRAPRRCRG